MRHFVCYPCAEPSRGHACGVRWAAAGYEPLIMTYLEDWQAVIGSTSFDLMAKPKPWPGYYQVINAIAAEAFARGADLVTCIGDDMAPPEQGAPYHTELYFNRFPDGLGVMQCTGDRQGGVIEGRVAAERICGSPTFGRAWNKRAFLGNGPFGDFGFRSYYGDELLHESAKKLGLLYQEPELKIDHEHWSFGRTKREWWHNEASVNWTEDQRLFFSMKAGGFKEAVLA